MSQSSNLPTCCFKRTAGNGKLSSRTSYLLFSFAQLILTLLAVGFTQGFYNICDFIFCDSLHLARNFCTFSHTILTGFTFSLMYFVRIFTTDIDRGRNDF